MGKILCIWKSRTYRRGRRLSHLSRDSKGVEKSRTGLDDTQKYIAKVRSKINIKQNAIGIA